MIITSQVKLNPGKVYNQDDLSHRPFIWLGQIYYIYTFLTIRETTKEEFIEYVTTVYGEYADDIISWEFFYEVSID